MLSTLRAMGLNREEYVPSVGCRGESRRMWNSPCYLLCGACTTADTNIHVRCSFACDTGERLLQGPGENAGIVDMREAWLWL
jgi:hypothetical protein